MATYILVHGAWVGAWSWEKTVPFLESAGHRVVAVELPGHGADRTPADQITLQSYVDTVGACLTAQSEPVILVGHSLGGIVITQAAEDFPEKVAKLVYACAYLPRDGESVVHLAQQDPDPVNNVLRHLVFHEAEGVIELTAAGAREALFADVAELEAERAVARLVREPLVIPMTPVRTTAGRAGTILRYYLTTTHDRAISPALQQQMYAAAPCEQVVVMETGHCPFLARPEEFATHLARL